MGGVTFEAEDGIGVIRLDRPRVHNAIDGEAMNDLEKILDDLDRQPEMRVLIVTGAGDRTFCAGGDLSYFATLEGREAGLAMSQRMQTILRRLDDGPRPVIAAVNGDCWGGGCEILMACHFRIAVKQASFSFRQAAMGVVTGWGGGARVLRLLGRSRALRLLLTADTLDAEEACRIGLIDSVVEDGEQLMAEARSLAGRILANAPSSITAFLDLARTYEHHGAAAAEQRERELFAESWVGEHFRRRVAEWQERRKTRS